MTKHNLQKTIIEIIVQSQKNGLPFITNKQIVEQLKLIVPEIENPDEKVRNALYLIKRKKQHWDEPKIIREKEGWVVG